jgi:DNA polymerase III subunit chi
MKVDFYHLGGSEPAAVVRRIAERLIGEGSRLLVVSADEGALDQLDRRLWAEPPESFLPHTRAGHARAADQPVLLASDLAPPANGAKAVALVDGRWRPEALGFERAFHLFDEDVIGEAREAWRSLAASGAERNFWRHEEGRWRKIA